MDLHAITALSRPGSAAAIPPWQPGDAVLAGGTWLFSEPQPGATRLIDIAGLGWDGLAVTPEGLSIGATCPIAALTALETPPEWRAAALFRPCADALVASFKVQATATVGGNLCLALPAGAMIALTAALDGVCTLWSASGERRVPAAGFVTGNRRTVLRPGEMLRRIDLPAASLRRRAAMRRIALSPLGRSGALLIGTRGEDLVITVTAATVAPVVLRFDTTPGTITAGAITPGAITPGAAMLAAALDAAIPDAMLHDDVHGDPAWRRHVTRLLAEELRQELCPDLPS